MDVVVIGAGVCGLAAAGLLAPRRRVVVFEASARPGGVAQVSELDGARFCAGPQYLWGFAEGGPGRRILGKMGLSLPMEALGAGFDQLAIGDGDLQPVTAGQCAPLLAEIVRRRPEQAAPIARLTRLLDDIGEACEALSARARFMGGGAEMLRHLTAVLGPGHRAAVPLLRSHRLSLAALARQLGVGPAALRALAPHQAIFAESLSDLSAVLFAAARHHLKSMLWVPVGGTRRLIETLVSHARAHGELRLRHRVVSVTPRGDGWEVVAQAPGSLRRVRTRQVIFACAPPVTAALLPQLSLRYQPSNGVSALCLSITGDRAVMDRLANRNINWFASPDADIDFAVPAASLATLNVTSPTLNGGPRADRAVVVAFYPHGRDPEAMARAAEARLLSLLRPWGAVSVRARRLIDRRAWAEDFGSTGGAIYGRRLSAPSMLTPAFRRLPPGALVAHSGAGISGVMGCLEMAERAADQVLRSDQHDRAVVSA